MGLVQGWNRTQWGHLGVTPCSSWPVVAVRVSHNPPEDPSPLGKPSCPQPSLHDVSRGSRPHSYGIRVLLLHPLLWAWLHSQSGSRSKQIDDAVLELHLCSACRYLGGFKKLLKQTWTGCTARVRKNVSPITYDNKE